MSLIFFFVSWERPGVYHIRYSHYPACDIADFALTKPEDDCLEELLLIHIFRLPPFTSPSSIACLSIMSRASKLTLLGTSLFAASTVVFVHFQQTFEKEVCARIRLPSGG